MSSGEAVVPCFLKKFESATGGARAKSISFHPSRPWLLVSFYSGSVQIWDHKLQVLVDTYDGYHDGTFSLIYALPLMHSFCGRTGEDVRLSSKPTVVCNGWG